MQLKELIKDLSALEAVIKEVREVTGVACDSRLVKPSDLFVAVHGVRDNGDLHIASALERGAAAIVSELPPPPNALNWIQVADSRAALATLACNFYDNPSRKMKVFGVTGTNGKTTIAGLTRDILEAADISAGLISTVEYSFAERCIAASRTTPDAVFTYSLLDSMLRAGCGAAVMEVSSHALSQSRVAGLRYEAVAFTNLSHDHLDYHHDFENYYTTKRKLFEQAAKLNPGCAAIINIDDPYGARLAEEVKPMGLKPVTYSIEKAADIFAADISLAPNGSTFALRAQGVERKMRVKLLGRYNVANILCAFGLARDAGIALETIFATLESAAPRWGRLEKIAVNHPAAIFVDYAHTDDALKKVLSALREVTSGRIITVFGCGGNRDRAKRPLMGAAVAEAADFLVVTSDNPRNEDPEEIIREITAGIPKSAEFVCEANREKAIRTALSLAREGDSVLIAGKGHETFQEIANKMIPFDDREIVRKIVSEEL